MIEQGELKSDAKYPYDRKLKQFVATLSAESENDSLPPFIELSAEVRENGGRVTTKRGYLRTGKPGAVTDEPKVVVGEATRKKLGIPSGTSVTVSESSAWRYYPYRLRSDKRQGYPFIGLIVTAIGLIIEATVAVGKIHPLWIVSDAVIAGSLIIALVLKVVGLIVIFWKGVLEDEE